ncbi:Homeobox protein YOX1 [Termitomyces sp. T112]|nr:hypothetical protein C0989_004391 [Termitomyces sp. Mn162]KAG5728880.1 Homeobox protein YOX1 [Termitomyces sp. T112]KAH0588890.1 hypothetical protein H2248_004679 [Termitomyces sp. 'cryptogamus']KNZ77108.1 Homeobox protein YOX1 [Termitomyces sp. J132]
MSNDRFLNSYTKPRTPDHSQGFFQTGQGGRPVVLPPISSFNSTLPLTVPSYPPQCTPRSSPARYEVNHQVLYNYSAEPATSYPFYDTHERYPASSQNCNYTSRTSPPLVAHPADNRKLPQLSTSNGGGWSTTPYMTTTSYQSGSNIRSPTASYPGLYGYPQTNQGSNYTYLPTQEHSHVQIPTMLPSAYNTDPYGYSDPSRSEHHRSSSPYGRSSSHAVPTSTTPPPVSPTTPEESTIKKKRKRADARQLKVLNETYNRTAFPSTEERLALAKELDMTARSVQIWFQNKRQSMRQTNRQSSTMGSSSSQPFSVSGQDPLEELEHSPMGYGNPLTAAEVQYASRQSPDTSRLPHVSVSSSQRRVRHEEPEHRKYY